MKNTNGTLVYAGGGGDFNRLATREFSEETSKSKEVNHLLTRKTAFTMADRLSLFHNGLDGLKSAFTMAEILLSLTIIGVVAAITLPSLTGNINERTWNTQRKALFSRMNQAISLMPAINGYGTFDGTTDTAAEAFVTAGLSKVLKINNICDKNHLHDCGLPSKFTDVQAVVHNALPAKVSSLNANITAAMDGTTITVPNTTPVAFETANGESVLAFYNPQCKPVDVLLKGTTTGTSNPYYIKQQVCANFIYDLNGKKGPNTMGKDMGFMTVMYPSDSRVVMPMYPKNMPTDKNHEEAAESCGDIENGEYRLPNIEELLAIYYNKNISGNFDDVISWSATPTGETNRFYALGFAIGQKYSYSKTISTGYMCVQR